MSLNKNMKVKSGAEKRKLKRVTELKLAASDPKQTKICFGNHNTSNEVRLKLNRCPLF